MEFKKYPSIENSYRKKFLDKIVEEGHSKETFVVQEKVHGANFSVWMTENDFKVAKRSGFIEEGEKFFNYQEVVDTYMKRLRGLFEHLQITQIAEEVVVYGELYGGNYPHKDVPKTNQSSVQGGVFYSPKQDFIAFDIKMNGRYLDVGSVNRLCATFAIPHAETLKIGTIEECLEYPNEFQTTIPLLEGLPDIEGNMCEGVVIRPVRPLYIFSGERLILKNKNEKFTEKHGFDESKRKVKEITPLSEGAQQAIEKITQYINDNRLKNVVSKIGEVSQKDFGKVMGLFTQDIIEDFLKDEQEFFDTLEKSDRKLVTKQVGQEAAKMVRASFMNIVDGEF